MNFLLSLLLATSLYANSAIFSREKACAAKVDDITEHNIRHLADKNHFVAFQDARDHAILTFQSSDDATRLIFLDTPELAKLFDNSRQPVEPGRPNVSPSEKVLAIDHHNAFYDSKNPEKNSTMILMDFIEGQMKGPTATPKELRKINDGLGVVTTDNLGDGALAIWVRKNYDKVANNPELRTLLREITYYEDFGVFGSKYEADAKKDPLKSKALATAQAVLHGYDMLLLDADKKLSKRTNGQSRITSDRFTELTSEEQHALIDGALGVIDKALSDNKYREEGAANFARLRNSMENHIANAQLKTALPEINKHVFAYDLKGIPGDNVGLFAKWSAPSQVHDKSLELKIAALPNGRTSFILAVPHGREFSSALKPIGDAILKAHLKKNPESDAGIVSGRAKLQFSFVGVDLKPEEILQIVNDELARMN